MRVFLPEATVLRAHFHQHTEEEPVWQAPQRLATKHMLTPKHQHCHVEQLYDAPFQPSLPVCVAEPMRLLAYAIYRPQAPVCRASHLLDGASLRGPPAQQA
ncbi:hypothetical protein [Hymenobacter cavernae]|uniref:hypothetical protein n=1 Tax=Hymenobacter cavernae TaxID=2044852 RepID=UPI001662C100|nr:hypothetical protein [Hymenobacter cavernae]